jgi:hypothetical protein
VTRLELRSVRDVPGLLVAAMSLRRGLRRAPGAVSSDLAAQPLTRTFWTWSVWTDENAARSFVRSAAHLRVARRYGARLRASDVRVVGPRVPPRTWVEARRLVLADELVDA